jgi:cell division ATPase FtsA
LAKDSFYTAVDLGNGKVASIMARVGTEGELKILGTGIVPSQGMHKGRIERIDEVLDRAIKILSRSDCGRVFPCECSRSSSAPGALCT